MALRTHSRNLGSKLSCMLARTSFLHSHATSFGFKEVREEEKSKMVGDVFSKVASNYDLMNDLMSAGLHRLWKDRLVSKLHPFTGMKHLDVAGGTGDVAFRIFENINSISRRAMQSTPGEDLQDETQIYVCDINPNMLNVGKKRAAERGLGENRSLIWVEGDAEALKFEDGTMDGYTIAFGIRNVTHIEKALAEAYRVLKHGGRFLCLELSHVDVPVFKELYDYYSFSVIPAVGELVAGDRASYQYLIESIRKFPPQPSMSLLSPPARCGWREVVMDSPTGGILSPSGGVICSFGKYAIVEAPTVNQTSDYALCPKHLRIQRVQIIASVTSGNGMEQEKFAGMIADAGFQKVEYENLVGGVVSIHSGFKF